MAKPKLKSYRITKRFTVWLDAEVKAADFASATEAGKKLTCFQMMKQTLDGSNDVASIIDDTELEGFSVGENWD